MTEETDSRIPFAARKAVRFLREEFTHISKEHCNCRQGDLCDITGGPCTFANCPKIREKIKEKL
ncbi:hypothetical protein AKJ41_01080 [candidate division MSBL1 archaeon SCGC-AAA259O05]|uniref:Uncharacterized protein n=1 Tax=candidate division MSBL1 archaeon SCGC-AAA259O05 TaxID=1698271 RepID=A0A133V538_9EURY|nr:hypothetical protein AKJ41_01080 [candidate division MSBL1 archaeon SCGC-AAA259O05]